jgi:hypothetical protein
MAKPDQKYFVSVEVKWGKQEGDKQVVESTGGQNWGYLTYEQSVMVQNASVIPGVVKMLDEAGKLGMDMIGEEV